MAPIPTDVDEYLPMDVGEKDGYLPMDGKKECLPTDIGTKDEYLPMDGGRKAETPEEQYEQIPAVTRRRETDISLVEV